MIAPDKIADIWYLRYGNTLWVEKGDLDATWQKFAAVLKKHNLLAYEWIAYSKTPGSSLESEVYKLKTQ